MLTANGHRLFFYTQYNEEKKRNDIEIDFIISNNSKTKYKIYPIEVKSGMRYTTESLHRFREKFKNRIGGSYIVHPRNLIEKDDVLCMPTVRSGAYDYIGYLDFPGYGLTMPVAATWSFPALEISPCRHAGSVYNDNLVVAGHNYNTHFGVLFELQLGDIVTFTDVDGNAFTYTVRELTSVSPDDSDAVMNRGYALTLYTCNWDTTERVTVFCERANGEV